ncbi:MAG: ABC transporter ATP-binding protein [Fibrobacteria bacterium]|nr:ABC transporter ATP-binding protein [Fibrobacteria bacterium]
MGREEVPVLHGIDFSLEPGDFGAIMGPSGSGKSTLLNILGCLDRPTRGEYRIEGRQVSGLSEDELADLRSERIGFVFQSFQLLPRLNLFENVELPLRYLGIPKAERRRKVSEMMERLGIGDRGKHVPAEVSGGQRQRAAVARALVKDPAILLADEPTGNLDSTTTAEVLDLFDQLNREGNTILLITHEAEVASRARRRWKILDGRMEEIA